MNAICICAVSVKLISSVYVLSQNVYIYRIQGYRKRKNERGRRQRDSCWRKVKNLKPD